MHTWRDDCGNTIGSPDERNIHPIVTTPHAAFRLSCSPQTSFALRRWIEGEGAYDVIKIPNTGAARNQHEKLIQKSLKTQGENIFLRRGFQVDVVREAQLLDEKRPDFLLRYGFAGPIIIEVKLTSNADMKGNKIASSASYKSMQRYMDGFGSAHGVFLIVNNTNAKNLPTLTKIFEMIPNVTVQIFDGFEKLSGTKKKVRVKRDVGNSRKIPPS